MTFGTTWVYHENGGFFSDQPHICLEATYQYGDEDKTELDRYVVVSEKGLSCYNVWNHYFTREMLQAEIGGAGFSSSEFYGDIAGKEFSDEGETVCAVFTK